MRLSHQVRIFLIIFISTFLIFSFSHYGVLAYGGIKSHSKQFPENTWIGSININGLEKDEAIKQLKAKILEWQTSSKINLFFQEANVTLPLDDFTFNVNESIQNINASSKNKLDVNIDESQINAALASLSPSFSEDEVDVLLLKKDLLKKASSLDIGTIEINIEDYFQKPIVKDQIIHTITIPIENGELQNIGATLVIEPKSTFSLVSFLEKQGFMELESNSINLISSGVYQTILLSNFQLTERHIGLELPTGIPLGYEAKINPELKWDLSFYNPNTEEFKIEIYSDGQSLIFDLVGIPFLYKYSITEQQRQEFVPKTIKQFSPLLAPGESDISRNGQSGYYVELFRLFKDESDTIIGQELISKDYYAPIPQIEEVGLTNPINSLESIYTSDLTDAPNIIVNESTKSAVETNDSNNDLLWGKPDETPK